MFLKIVASLISCLVFSSFSLSFAAIPAPIPGGNLYIPKGTQIAVELEDPVSSTTSFIGGEILAVNVLEDYILNNVVVIEKGAQGFVSVVEKTRSGEWGKAGAILIRPQYLKTNNWVKVQLNGDAATSGKSHGILKPFVFGAAGLAGLVKDVAGVGGAFLALLVFPDPTPGGEAIIPAGTKLVVSVSEDTDLGVTAEGLVKAMTIDPVRRGGDSSPSAAPNFSGVWTTRKGKVILYQSRGAQTVTGHFEETGGALRGNIKGNRLIGRWNAERGNASIERGDFEVLLSGNGENAVLLWKRDYAPNWSQDRFAARISEL